MWHHLFPISLVPTSEKSKDKSTNLGISEWQTYLSCGHTSLTVRYQSRKDHLMTFGNQKWATVCWNKMKYAVSALISTGIFSATGARKDIKNWEGVNSYALQNNCDICSCFTKYLVPINSRQCYLFPFNIHSEACMHLYPHVCRQAEANIKSRVFDCYKFKTQKFKAARRLYLHCFTSGPRCARAVAIVFL